MGDFPPVDDPFKGMKTAPTKKKVTYMQDWAVGDFAYAYDHPMKPHRVRLTHSLVMNYQLHRKMEVYRANPARFLDMTRFHTDEYIQFLQMITPENKDQHEKEQTRFGVGGDSPIFDGMFDFCALSAGGSLEGAARLNKNQCDIAINWAGGLHHAKSKEASGFCYVNDIVLAILELLRYHQRVLYIDIDVHHGDGVEEAFFTTDRVMTVSLHKYGDFFPWTGDLDDIGKGKGKNYSINFPLRDGIDDASYKYIFEKVIGKVMEVYRPNAVVLQCGADSLSGDRIGQFNLSSAGHANCVSFVKSFNVPTLVLGGGGYTLRNVARAWTYETAICVGQPIAEAVPYTAYYEYFSPDFTLNVRDSNRPNENSPQYLEKVASIILENLRGLPCAPSVQMTEIPEATMGMTDEEEAALKDEDEDEDKENDIRKTDMQKDERVCVNEVDPSDDDEEDDVFERMLKRQRRW